MVSGKGIGNKGQRRPVDGCRFVAGGDPVIVSFPGIQIFQAFQSREEIGSAAGRLGRGLVPDPGAESPLKEIAAAQTLGIDRPV